MAYFVQWPKQGAYKKFSGNVPMSELLDSLSIVQCNPNYDTFKFTITDFLDVEKIDFNEADVTLYGARVIGGEMTNSRLVVGIVVTNPEIIHMLKTRYERLVGYSIGYFANLEDCTKWIKVKTGTDVEVSP
jgi:hypothetical protein